MAKKKGFNEHKTIRDKTVIFLLGNKKEKLESIIDTKHLERIQNLNLHFRGVWGHFGNSYYARATKYCGTINGKPKYEMVYLHHLIKELPISGKKYHIDHKNHKTLDNRENNLVIKFAKGNLVNRGRINSNNTSGYRNVSWIKGFWRVQLQVNGKNKLFPEKFTDVEEAGKFAEQMRNKYYGTEYGKYE